VKEKMLDTWSEEKIDAFLLNQYGYGIGHFRLSYIRTWQLYDYYNVRAKSSEAIKKEQIRLASVKRKITDLLDDYLSAIEFYGNSLHFEAIKNTGITKWTPENKELFIRKYFQLDNLFTIIDRPNDWFVRVISEDAVVPRAFGIYRKLRLRPFKLLTLVWANAVKRKSKNDWINMAGLFSWFFKHLESPFLNELICQKERDQLWPGALRIIWNRYKRTDYQKTAETLFRGLSLVQDPKALLTQARELEREIDRKFFKSPEAYGKARARFFCIASLFPEIFSRAYEGLSTKELDFDLTLLSLTSSSWYQFPD